MSNEELEKVLSQSELLLENGFAIEDPTYFVSFGSDEDLKKTIDELNELKNEATRPVNIDFFNRRMLESLGSISDTLEVVPYFRNSVESSEFYRILADVERPFTEAKGYYDAVTEAKARMDRTAADIKARNEIVEDIKRRIFGISQDKSLDDISKTKETFRLRAGLEQAKRDVDFSTETLENQEKIYQDALNQEKSYKASLNDVVELKNNLLRSINALDDNLRKQENMPFEVKEAVAKTIREMRDAVVVLDLARQQKESEFKEALRKHNLKYDESIIAKYHALKEAEAREAEQEEVREEEPLEQPVVENNYEEPVASEKEEIVTVESLAIALRQLNPDVEIETLDETRPLIADYTLLASVPVSKLILPENFYIDANNYISNKETTKAPRGEYIAVEVLPLERKETVEATIEPEQTLEEQAVLTSTADELEAKPEEVVENVVEKSAVPSGKQKVTKIRRANVAPYVQSALSLGVVGAIVGIPTVASLAPAAVFAGVGLAAQALYGRLAKKGVVDKHFESTEFAEHPEQASFLVAGAKAMNDFRVDKTKAFSEWVKSGSSKLLSDFRNYRKEKQLSSLEQVEKHEEVMDLPVQEAPVAEQPVATELSSMTPTEEEKYKNSIAGTFDEAFSSELNLGDTLEDGYELGGR